jgi:hypothetical protein
MAEAETQIYFARFVDRDMLMRYHWGLAIGHLYTHGQATPADLDKRVSDNAPPNIEPEDLGDFTASSRMDAGVRPDLEPAAEQIFSRQEEHCDMDHGPSAGDDCDGEGDSEWLDTGSEVADDDVDMEREGETDDEFEASMMIEEMYF